MKGPELDWDALIWRARETAVSLVTAGIEGVIHNDPSLPLAAMKAGEAAVPASQTDEFRRRLVMMFAEVIGTTLAVTVSVAGGDTTGSIEDTGRLMLAAWREIVPAILDGNPTTENLAGAGETLMGELDDWLPRQPPPDPT